jgi:hypothetical protein
MEGDPGMYVMAKWAFDAALDTNHLGWWLKPFLAIYLILRFFNWSYRTARGESMDELDDMGAEAFAGVENRARYGREYGTRKGQGFSDAELRDIGRGRRRF